MASATATSKIAPVVVGSGQGKSTTYIASKVSGPDKNGDYTSEIIQTEPLIVVNRNLLQHQEMKVVH